MIGILDSPVSGLTAHGVVTVAEAASLEAAARHMAARQVGAVVVMHGARPVGLLSERDISERIGAGVDPTRDTAGGAMSSPLVVAHCGDTVRALLTQMAALGIRHLPLVDDDGHLVSLVSLSELVRRLVDDGTTIDLRQPESGGASRWFG